MKRSSLTVRSLHLLTAAVVVISSLSTVLVSQSTVAAAQLSSRSIRMTSSAPSDSLDVTYTVTFTTSTASVIQGIVIDFCSNSPVVGSLCTAPTGFDTTATLGIGTTTGVTGFTKDAATTVNKVVLTNATGVSVPAGTAVTIPLGTAAANDGITNPSTIGTFYARILTYATPAGATGYSSATTGANNPGADIDFGSVALSTARQLTVSAQVQEQLEFCVSAIAGSVDTNVEAPANCSAAPFNGSLGTNIEMGAVDSNAPSITPVPITANGNDRNGAVMIRTNAVSGAVISYYAEQNTSSGKLKVPGATCSGTVTTDQCFNSAGTTQLSFATAGEKFGMTASAVLRPTGSITTNLNRSTDYDGDGTAAVGFAWVDTGANNPATTLASSSTVLDYEMLVLRFAARTAPTTPTGSYSVTSTYIATATF